MRDVFEQPGHMDLWYENAVQNTPDTRNAILDKLAQDGFNATCDGPTHVIYKDLMARYPNAKVILTVRPNPSAENWSESFYESVGRLITNYNDIPFRWIPFIQKFVVLLRWMWDEYAFGELNLPINPETGLPFKDDIEKVYVAWIEDAKAHVPPEKLLIFSPSDGWEPLCSFIAPLATTIESACREILESNEPYPFVNDTANVLLLVRGLQGIVYFTKALPVIFFLMIIGSFQRKRRAKKSSKLE